MTEELKKEFSKLRFLDENGETYPEWEEKQLQDIAEVIGGGTPSTGNSNYWDGNINWFSPAEIKSKYVESSEKTITEEGLKKSSAKLLPIGTVLVTTRATLGRMAILNQPATTNQGFQNVITKKELINEFFYYHQPLIEKFCESKAGGSTFKEISKSQFVKYALNLPSLPEQTKIAELLSKKDEKIEAQSSLVELLKKQKQGYSQKIFNGSLRFKKDDGTDYPDWEEKKLGSIGKFYRGNGLPKVDMIKNGKYDCVHYGELFSSSIVFTPVNKTDFNGVKFNKGTILMPSSDVTPDGLAKASVIQKDNVVVGGDTNVIIPIGENNSIFIAQMIRFYKNKIIREVVGTTVKHIYPKNLQTISYGFPSLPEQEKIAAFLSSLDNRIDEELNKLEKLKLEKNGYMQRVLA